MIVLLMCLHAQGDTIQDGNPDVFRPDSNSFAYTAVSSARVLPKNSFRLSTGGYFWKQPSTKVQGYWSDLPIDSRFVGQFSAAYSPVEQFSIAAGMQYLFDQQVAGQSQDGVGDLQLQLKYGRAKKTSAIKYAISSEFSFPTGDAELWMGAASTVFHPTFIVELLPKDKPLRWGAELGYSMTSSAFQKGVTAGMGLGLTLTDGVEVYSEYQSMFGTEMLLVSNISGGVICNIGRFAWRGWILSPVDTNVEPGNIQVGMSAEVLPIWRYRSKDEDRDGIPNRVDDCPNRREDFDGFQDSDGCPESDNDQDGILDLQDECPLEKEDQDGFLDSDGCMDSDNDQDNILDFTDRCPDKAETINGYRDFDGCPDHSMSNDYDGDRFTDNKDKCPFLAEDFDGFEDDDGCPEIDNDNDGILDGEE